VEVLGGQISVESTPGKGTTFTFSVPFTLTNQPLRKGNEMGMLTYSFGGHGIRLLVVEDNPMNLKYLSSLLSKYDLEFDIATNGKSALDKAIKVHYNLILMDMKLPGMNGTEVAANIRKMETPNAATPIILVSAAAFQSTADKAKECGVNELLTKPYTPNQLLTILLKYLVEDEDDDAVPMAVPPAEDVHAFKFDERLDTAYLQKLYSGNFSYAVSLFEVFIECMEKDWDDIQHAVEEKDFITLKNLVHKVKPNFSMVGLTWITDMMQQVYNHLKQNNNQDALERIEDVHKELEDFMPLIKRELSRMESFAGQGIA
jgi:CheY-like chemotaxis protein/HPt (histidine-containing phosphotransfer) domain-containing protein